MDKINWKVRFRNKHFWMTVIPLILIIGERIAFLFGFEWSVDHEYIVETARIILILFAGLGIVEDHTTEGIGDSEQALTYEKPRKKETISAGTIDAENIKIKNGEAFIPADKKEQTSNVDVDENGLSSKGDE